jgi:uncharacterized protein YndB with AHSA1/START domain
MPIAETARPRVLIDDDGTILAVAELPASPERVFHALASDETASWWVRPGVFDTHEWSGDVRAGGRWRASGEGRAGPFALEGEFLEVDAPRRLVHTWRRANAPDGETTTVTYLLERSGSGTQLTLRHAGFAGGPARENTAIGWETSLERLAEILTSPRRA